MSQKFNAPLSTLDQMTNAELSPNDRLACEQTASFNGTGLAVGELDKRYLSQSAGANAALRLASGVHVPTSGEASGTTLTIATGLAGIVSPFVMVVTTSTGKVATTDAAISLSGGNLTIANGSTFTLATTQTIFWIAAGN